jgi:two-component system, NarL family, nitrate/nitrite response regulator NarL
MTREDIAHHIDGHVGRDSEPGVDDTLRVIVVHENEVMRQGLATMLKALPMSPEVLSCAYAGAALRLIDEQNADVVILSAVTSGGGPLAFSLAEEVASHAAKRDTKIVILLSTCRDDGVAAAVPCDGILVEEGITSATIGEALSRLRRGDMPVPSTVVRGLLSEVRSLRGQGDGPSVKASYLTPREQATLELLVQGLSNKQIARRLSISEHGVKRHVANILAKLNCPNRTLAAAMAIREGLVDLS